MDLFRGFVFGVIFLSVIIQIFARQTYMFKDGYEEGKEEGRRNAK